MKALSPVRRIVNELDLHTVCESARCPNRQTCFAASTAAFMILGDICTRNCTFCAVQKGEPHPGNVTEPERCVAAVERLGLKHVVITSVTRDDLPDGGAAHFARTLQAVHAYSRQITTEVLIPDFGGSAGSLRMVVEAQPDVLNHNVETVPRLYPEVRPQAVYRRSIELLKLVKSFDTQLLTKSGVMLGLGESKQEIAAVMSDLRRAGCDFLTIGQYLPPSLGHHELVRYVPPEEFEDYRALGEEMGFASVVSGPLVRSSFHAAEAYLSTVRSFEGVNDHQGSWTSAHESIE
jgi:lipoic acid synthetase